MHNFGISVQSYRDQLERENGYVDEDLVRDFAEAKAASRERTNMLRRGFDGGSFEEVTFEEEYLTKEEYAQRQTICADCEFLKGSICTEFKKSCGCGGDLHASRQRRVKCPKDKW